MRAGKVHSKMADYFYLKVLKLNNLTNKFGEKSEIITSSTCKIFEAGPRKDNRN